MNVLDIVKTIRMLQVNIFLSSDTYKNYKELQQRLLTLELQISQIAQDHQLPRTTLKMPGIDFGLAWYLYALPSGDGTVILVREINGDPEWLLQQCADFKSLRAVVIQQTKEFLHEIVEFHFEWMQRKHRPRDEYYELVKNLNFEKLVDLEVFLRQAERLFSDKM